LNYIQLTNAIQDYTENTFTQVELNTFIISAEQRILNSVQLPSLRRNVTAYLSAQNPYLQAPLDFLSVFSFAVINPTTGEYYYLLDKDVNFIRASFPSPTYYNTPAYYAIFGPRSDNEDFLTFMMGPTPDQSYEVELHYFYYPTSIVQGSMYLVSITQPGIGYPNGTYYNISVTGGAGSGALATVTVVGGSVTNVTIDAGGSLYLVGDVCSISPINGQGSGCTFSVTNTTNPSGTSWLGNNFESSLLYGSLIEAYTFMKGDADIMAVYTKRYDEALLLLKQLGDGKDRGDAYRDGQVRYPVK